MNYTITGTMCFSMVQYCIPVLSYDFFWENDFTYSKNHSKNVKKMWSNIAAYKSTFIMLKMFCYMSMPCDFVEV